MAGGAAAGAYRGGTVRVLRAANAWNQRRREEREGPGARPIPVGKAEGAEQVGGGTARRFLLDEKAYAAVRELKKRYWAECERYGRPKVAWQTSRIVRAAIREHAAVNFGEKEGRRERQPLCPYPMSVYLDAESLSVLRAHARASFGGNESAALREMLKGAARPRAVLGRRYEPGQEPVKIRWIK